MNTDTANPSPTMANGIEKFYQMNDNMDAVQGVVRRVFFEFLLTKPTLTDDEIQMLWSVSDLLADISAGHRKAQAE